MKAITKTDIKRIRKAIKIADEGQDYDLFFWAFGEIESVLNKAEKVLEKAGKQLKKLVGSGNLSPICQGRRWDTPSGYHNNKREREGKYGKYRV